MHPTSAFASVADGGYRFFEGEKVLQTPSVAACTGVRSVGRLQSKPSNWAP